jgi:3-oxoacyl-[acyl-carrier-protein] synthase III
VPVEHVLQPSGVPSATRSSIPRTAGIAAVGAALPELRVGNAQVASRLGVSEEWIERRTGISERRRAAPGQRVSDLAASAGRIALERAGMDADELDLVLVATVAGDEIMPAVAPVVAEELGARTAAAIDVGAACAGAISALALATASVEAGRARHALVIGAEILTRFLDLDDRLTAPLFGDGAGAIVVSSDAAGSIGPFVFGSDGSRAHTLRIPRESGLFEMDGHETFLRAVECLSACTLEALGRAELALDEVDLFVYHQANSRILAAVAERLSLPCERVFDCIAELGNTSAASVPLALNEAVRVGALRPGARVVLAAIGAGLVWGATTLTWGEA